MKTEVKAAAIGGICILGAAIIYVAAPSLIESYSAQSEIEIVDWQFTSTYRSLGVGPLEIVNSSTNDVIARYDVSLPQICFILKNKGNEEAAITKITVSVITVSVLEEIIQRGAPGAVIFPSANYTLELNSNSSFIDIGSNYSIPVKFKIEPGKVDCFTLTIDDSEYTRCCRYLVNIILSYDHKKVETGPIGFYMAKQRSYPAKFLFSVNASDFKKELKNLEISEDMRLFLNNKGIILYDNPTIKTTRDGNWIIRIYKKNHLIDTIKVIINDNGMLDFWG
jgi:hypothetical protein